MMTLKFLNGGEIRIERKFMWINSDKIKLPVDSYDHSFKIKNGHIMVDGYILKDNKWLKPIGRAIKDHIKWRKHK